MTQDCCAHVRPSFLSGLVCPFSHLSLLVRFFVPQLMKAKQKVKVQIEEVDAKRPSIAGTKHSRTRIAFASDDEDDAGSDNEYQDIEVCGAFFWALSQGRWGGGGGFPLLACATATLAALCTSCCLVSCRLGSRASDLVCHS